MGEDRVYLVDASIYVCRAWFALPLSVTDRTGGPANAVYGFIDFVARLLSAQRPRCIAFVFDESPRSSFRNLLYPAYKANRPTTPPELRRQFLQCREFIRALGYLEISSAYFEADDLIGALAATARRHGHQSTIISADKDLTQLLRDGDLWWDFANGVRLDAGGVLKRFGVRPEQIADLLAIAGDKVDNIPGVPGVGLATAAKLLRRFDSLENMLSDMRSIGAMKMRGAARIQKLIETYQDTLRLTQRLTRIDCTSAVPAPPQLVRQLIDPGQLDVLFDTLNYGVLRRERWSPMAEAVCE